MWISFVYYIDVRENDPLLFSIENKNEWFGDAFYFVNNRHELNGLNYAVQPKNESLLIFPGSLRHFTAAQRNYKRMSIAGDVLLTLKENMLDFESGLLPNKYWNWFGELAQLVERLLCKQDVSGSSPLFSICSSGGMVYAADLESAVARLGGSSPLLSISK